MADTSRAPNGLCGFSSSLLASSGRWQSVQALSFAGRNGPNGPKIPGTTYDDYYHSIEQVASLTQFVRAKVYDLDENGREKWIDYDRVFSILRKAHFNGFISMIYEGKEDKFTVIPNAIRFLRSFVMS